MRRRMTSPMTNEALPDAELRPNHAMRSMIQSWVSAANGARAPSPPQPDRAQSARSPLPRSERSRRSTLDHSLRLPVAVASALAAGSSPAGPLANSRTFEVENRAHADIIAEGIAVSAAVSTTEAEAAAPSPSPAGVHVASATAPPTMPSLLEVNCEKLLEGLDMLLPHARLPFLRRLMEYANDPINGLRLPAPADYAENPTQPELVASLRVAVRLGLSLRRSGLLVSQVGYIIRRLQSDGEMVACCELLFPRVVNPECWTAVYQEFGSTVYVELLESRMARRAAAGGAPEMPVDLS